MTNDIWKRFPVMKGFRCLDMKEEIQVKVVADTRRVAPTALIAYFQEASRRFWQEAAHQYPESSTTSLAVSEKNTRRPKE